MISVYGFIILFYYLPFNLHLYFHLQCLFSGASFQELRLLYVQTLNNNKNDQYNV